MLQAVLDELERILLETNVIKHDLNYICESSWNLLCPPGSQDNGSFRVEKIHSSDLDSDSSEASTMPSPLEGTFNNVTDLINYGKLIRSNTHLLQNNIKGSRTISDVCKVQPRNKLNVYSVKAKDPLKPPLPKSKNVKLKKSLHNQISQEYSSNERNIRIGTETQDRYYWKNKEYVNTYGSETAVDTSFSKFASDTESSKAPTKYSHSCSLLLLDSDSKLKMPEDLRYLLKQFYSYENNKYKREDMCIFVDRFSELIKARLVHDLKTHTKNGERYMKYLDIADNVHHVHDSKINLSGINTQLLYKSGMQLCLYNAKSQRLLELQLERQLMDAISNAICSFYD